MYGIAGERRLTELELDWLPGYEGSQPVRIGNAASRQLQLDVYGEVARRPVSRARGRDRSRRADAWALNGKLLRWLEDGWRQPDEGIWEVRGPRRHFTHSKVMAWLAFDRAVRSVEEFGLEGPVSRWRAVRDEIHEQVCREGYDPELGAFTQSYGSPWLDASALLIPLVGFLPADDERVMRTVDAIERALVVDGLVMRTSPTRRTPSSTGSRRARERFSPARSGSSRCYVLQGRRAEAEALFERLLRLRNDLGLLSEEYDVASQRLVGNFPQAFTHLALVDAALTLDESERAGHPVARVRAASRSASRDGSS